MCWYCKFGQFLFWCCSLLLSSRNLFVFLCIVFNTVLLVCYLVLWLQISNKYLLNYLLLAPFVAWMNYSTSFSRVRTGMVDRLQAGMPPRYVTKPTGSTQPSIPPALLNRVPAVIGCGKGCDVTSAEWHVTLRDAVWHVSSHSGEARYRLLYQATYFTANYFWDRDIC